MFELDIFFDERDVQSGVRAPGGKMSDFRTLTHAEWMAEGTRRFGPDYDKWRFVCPVCGFVASVQDWKDVGHPDAVAFSCIGRWRKDGIDALTDGLHKGMGRPCNYAGGGLFKLNPVTVVFDDGIEHRAFEFAD